MDNQNDLPEQDNLSTVHLEKDQSDLPAQEESMPIIEQADNDLYADAPIPAEGEGAYAEGIADAPALPPKSNYKTVTVVFAFIFFAITLVAFIVYAFSGGTFLYNMLVTVKDRSVEDTVGTIFATLFGMIYMIFAGVAQFPANIVSIILFKRLMGKANARWKNVLFAVCFGLSIFMLVVLFVVAAIVAGMALFGGK